ncbi:hypothetical protein FS837_012892 [Tulasnella sp. UAMH 9824]|nr:hypothetical protein FS837_012892 [Tulasnella sp. UAMH 9824]
MSLLNEARRLQSLPRRRDKPIQDMEVNKGDLEKEMTFCVPTSGGKEKPLTEGNLEQAAALNREKSDLRASVDNLKTEMAKPERMMGKSRSGSPLAKNNPASRTGNPQTSSQPRPPPNQHPQKHLPKGERAEAQFKKQLAKEGLLNASVPGAREDEDVVDQDDVEKSLPAALLPSSGDPGSAVVNVSAAKSAYVESVKAIIHFLLVFISSRISSRMTQYHPGERFERAPTFSTNGPPHQRKFSSEDSNHKNPDDESAKCSQHPFHALVPHHPLGNVKVPLGSDM